jgi:uncharacterized membrane protein
MIPKILFVLAATFNAPMLPFISDLVAAQPSRTFLLRVCNQTQAHYGTLDLAVASLTADLNHIRVTGWVLLPPSRCVDVGQFQKPGVFLYAMSGVGAEMSGNATVLCVHAKEKFDYGFLLDASPPCPAKYVPKGFVLVQLPDLRVDGFTFTIE